MKHNCKITYGDGTVIEPFLDGVIDGVYEYCDFHDAYYVFYFKEKKFLFWKKRWGCVDILNFCPHCGVKIFDHGEKVSVEQVEGKV